MRENHTFVRKYHIYKPPQCLKYDFKDDLSMLSLLAALDCATFYSKGLFGLLLKKLTAKAIGAP